MVYEFKTVMMIRVEADSQGEADEAAYRTALKINNTLPDSCKFVRKNEEIEVNSVG